MTNFEKRIREEYSNPNSHKINGQSTAKNIGLMAERASENSKLAPRAKSGEPRLPSTGEEHIHSTHQKAGHTGDFYAEVRRDLNHDVRNPYMPGVRRTGK
jgi:hypothetical protein